MDGRDEHFARQFNTGDLYTREGGLEVDYPDCPTISSTLTCIDIKFCRALGIPFSETLNLIKKSFASTIYKFEVVKVKLCTLISLFLDFLEK